MDTMYIITRIMQSGPFSDGRYRYFLDYDGTRWIVKRALLFADGSYDAGSAESYCNFEL